MKELNEIMKNIDSLLKESKLEEAEKYMLIELEASKKENNWNISLFILNELAGFYRDLGKMSKALDMCMESERILDENKIAKTKERASAYLNTANVYRAKGDLDDSFRYYKLAKDVLEICGDNSLYSSYYNNLALLHQEAGKFDEAAKCLEKALYIAKEKMQDEIRTAISETNLANSLIRLKRFDEAYDYLKSAIEIFKGRTPSDFHYSAALAAMGDLSLWKGKTEVAADYFEAALSEIELHMGKNNFYDIVKDNLKNVYNLIGDKKKLKGLTLCEKYFNTFARPIIEKNFSNLKNHIACGLIGPGSECLSFDDEQSQDHDFGPSFIILADKEISNEELESLKNMYDNLPKTYMGLKRIETKEAVGRVGVIRIEDYLQKSIGFDHLPKNNKEWKYIDDENLILITNGKVFMDEGLWFENIRKHIRNDQPNFYYFNKIAYNLELMAKHGQYGYKRAFERKDYVAALFSKAEFVKACCRVCHLLAKQFAPYDKWLFRSLKELANEEKGRGKYFRKITAKLENISLAGVNEDDIAVMEDVCQIVKKMLKAAGLCYSKEDYLAVSANEIKDLANRSYLADEIVEMEWEMFDKTQNEGGRANCQDDWGTFSIMRRSQYYSWPMELLQTLYQDMSEGIKNGRNFITEKYAYMMESTAPAKFAEIKDSLNMLDDDKKAIINAIVEIQVGWMEEFAKEFPNLAGNARSIHTSEDNEFNTSYETYLRGELCTYNDISLMKYGQFIVDLSNKDINLAYRIMNMTVFFYGFASMEDANM